MELFKSLENRTKSFNDPFKHFEINQPLTNEAIKETEQMHKDAIEDELNAEATMAAASITLQQAQFQQAMLNQPGGF